MKILIDNYGDEVYTWKEAIFDGNFKVNGNKILFSSIISVHDDDRADLVKCSHCGQIFKAGSPELEAHRHLADTSETCLKCSHLNTRVREEISKSYEKAEWLGYIRRMEQKVELRCAYPWVPIDIDSDNARQACVYRGCTDAELTPFEDFFTKYPGAFDDIITVDKIIENGYKEKTVCFDNETRYTLRARNTIKAIVNKLGIVDQFYVYRLGYGYSLRYSKKYDKLFSVNSGFVEWNSFEVPTSTREYIKKTIAKLYN